MKDATKHRLIGKKVCLCICGKCSVWFISIFSNEILRNGWIAGFFSVSFTMQFASLWNISYWIIRLMNVCSDFTAFYCERITAAAIDRWYVKKSSLSRSAEKRVAMPIQIVRMLASGRQKLRFVTFCWEPVWAHDNFNSSPLFAQIQMHMVHALSAFIPKSKWRSESILSLCCE